MMSTMSRRSDSPSSHEQQRRIVDEMILPELEAEPSMVFTRSASFVAAQDETRPDGSPAAAAAAAAAADDNDNDDDADSTSRDPATDADAGCNDAASSEQPSSRSVPSVAAAATADEQQQDQQQRAPPANAESAGTSDFRDNFDTNPAPQISDTRQLLQPGESQSQSQSHAQSQVRAERADRSSRGPRRTRVSFSRHVTEHGESPWTDRNEGMASGADDSHASPDSSAEAAAAAAEVGNGTEDQDASSGRPVPEVLPPVRYEGDDDDMTSVGDTDRNVDKASPGSSSSSLNALSIPDDEVEGIHLLRQIFPEESTESLRRMHHSRVNGQNQLLDNALSEVGPPSKHDGMSPKPADSESDRCRVDRLIPNTDSSSVPIENSPLLLSSSQQRQQHQHQHQQTDLQERERQRMQLLEQQNRLRSQMEQQKRQQRYGQQATPATPWASPYATTSIGTNTLKHPSLHSLPSLAMGRISQRDIAIQEQHRLQLENLKRQQELELQERHRRQLEQLQRQQEMELQQYMQQQQRTMQEAISAQRHSGHHSIQESNPSTHSLSVHSFEQASLASHSRSLTQSQTNSNSNSSLIPTRTDSPSSSLMLQQQQQGPVLVDPSDSHSSAESTRRDSQLRGPGFAVLSQQSLRVDSSLPPQAQFQTFEDRSNSGSDSSRQQHPSHRAYEPHNGRHWPSNTNFPQADATRRRQQLLLQQQQQLQHNRIDSPRRRPSRSHDQIMDSIQQTTSELSGRIDSRHHRNVELPTSDAQPAQAHRYSYRSLGQLSSQMPGRPPMQRHQSYPRATSSPSYFYDDGAHGAPGFQRNQSQAETFSEARPSSSGMLCGTDAEQRAQQLPSGQSDVQPVVKPPIAEQSALQLTFSQGSARALGDKAEAPSMAKMEHSVIAGQTSPDGHDVESAQLAKADTSVSDGNEDTSTQPPLMSKHMSSEAAKIDISQQHESNHPENVATATDERRDCHREGTDGPEPNVTQLPSVRRTTSLTVGPDAPKAEATNGSLASDSHRSCGENIFDRNSPWLPSESSIQRSTSQAAAADRPTASRPNDSPDGDDGDDNTSKEEENDSIGDGENVFSLDTFHVPLATIVQRDTSPVVQPGQDELELPVATLIRQQEPLAPTIHNPQASTSNGSRDDSEREVREVGENLFAQNLSQMPLATVVQRGLSPATRFGTPHTTAPNDLLDEDKGDEHDNDGGDIVSGQNAPLPPSTLSVAGIPRVHRGPSGTIRYGIRAQRRHNDLINDNEAGDDHSNNDIKPDGIQHQPTEEARPDISTAENMARSWASRQKDASKSPDYCHRINPIRGASSTMSNNSNIDRNNASTHSQTASQITSTWASTGQVERTGLSRSRSTGVTVLDQPMLQSDPTRKQHVPNLQALLGENPLVEEPMLASEPGVAGGARPPSQLQSMRLPNQRQRNLREGRRQGRQRRQSFLQPQPHRQIQSGLPPDIQAELEAAIDSDSENDEGNIQQQSPVVLATQTSQSPLTPMPAEPNHSQWQQVDQSAPPSSLQQQQNELLSGIHQPGQGFANQLQQPQQTNQVSSDNYEADNVDDDFAFSGPRPASTLGLFLYNELRKVHRRRRQKPVQWKVQRLSDDFLRLPLSVAFQRYNSYTDSMRWELVQDLEDQALGQHKNISPHYTVEPCDDSDFYTVVLIRDTKVGLGMTLSEFGNRILVHSVAEERPGTRVGPAHEAGVKPDDYVIGINGIAFDASIIPYDDSTVLRHAVQAIQNSPDPLVVHLQKQHLPPPSRLPSQPSSQYVPHPARQEFSQNQYYHQHKQQEQEQQYPIRNQQQSARARPPVQSPDNAGFAGPNIDLYNQNLHQGQGYMPQQQPTSNDSRRFSRMSNTTLETLPPSLPPVVDVRNVRRKESLLDTTNESVASDTSSITNLTFEAMPAQAYKTRQGGVVATALPEKREQLCYAPAHTPPPSSSREQLPQQQTYTGRSVEFPPGIDDHNAKQLWGTGPPGGVGRRPSHTSAARPIGILRRSSYGRPPIASNFNMGLADFEVDDDHDGGTGNFERAADSNEPAGAGASQDPDPYPNYDSQHQSSGMNVQHQKSTSQPSQSSLKSRRIHPFAKALAKRDLLNSNEEEWNVTHTLDELTERTRQWEANLAMRIHQNDRCILPQFNAEDLPSELSALCLSSNLSAEAMSDRSFGPSTPTLPLDSPMIPKEYLQMMYGEDYQPGYTDQTDAGDPNGPSSAFNGGMSGQQGAETRSAAPTRSWMSPSSSAPEVFIPLVGVRKALCTRIVNTFPEGDRIAYTIWCYDVESGKEWYSPIRYLKDFVELRDVTVPLCPSNSRIAQLPFPKSNTNGLFGRKEVEESEAVKQAKIGQLEHFIRAACSLMYTHSLSPSMGELAVHIQSFLGCETAFAADSSNSVNQLHVDDKGMALLKLENPDHSEMQLQVRLMLKRSIQRYTYRLFLVESMSRIVDHFVDNMRARGPLLGEVESIEGVEKSALKTQALEEMDRMQAYLDHLQELVIEGCSEDFESIASRPEYRAIENWVRSSSGGERVYWNRLVREAIREQIEIEVYVPLRSVVSRLLVNGWRQEDMEVHFKMQQLRRRTQRDFQIPSKKISPSNWQSVAEILHQGVARSTLPCSKLRAIVDAAREISRLYSDEAVKADNGDDESLLSADDFLPIFTFAIVRAEMERPCALCVLLRTLCDSMNRIGEIGYFLATFESAVTHVQEINLSADIGGVGAEAADGIAEQGNDRSAGLPNS